MMERHGTMPPDLDPAPDKSRPAPSAKAFRNALGLFPTGVAVITTMTSDLRKVGLTVNSFTSVSLDPPLVSFNLAKNLHSIDDWLRADVFAVNLLRDNQDRVSNGFARARTDKWIHADCFAGRTSCPILSPNLATFECEKFACHGAGDHYIMIGKVVHFAAEDVDAAPLVFYRGAYRNIGDPI